MARSLRTYVLVLLSVLALALALPACGRIRLPGTGAATATPRPQGTPEGTPSAAPEGTPSATTTAVLTATAQVSPTTTSEATATSAVTPQQMPSTTAAPTVATTPQGTPTASAAGTPGVRRIQFAPGTDGISVQGALQPGASALWVLNARQGQTLSVRIVPIYGNAVLGVRGSDGSVLLSESAGSATWSGVLPRTQDYYLRVTAWQNTLVNYVLEVVIPPTPAVRRLQFPPGADRAIVQGSLAAGNLDQWLVAAQQGQTMAVQVMPTAGQVTLFIRGSDGTVLLSELPGTLSFTGTLPSTQDYVVQVRTSPQGTASYSLSVVIPPAAGATATPTGPAPKRISFAPGSVSGTVTGTIAAGGQDNWVFGAQAGQTFSARLTTASGTASFIVWGAEGSVIVPPTANAKEWTDTLTISQDYNLQVRGGTVTEAYTLDLIILPTQNTPATPIPTRISFAPGADRATVQGALQAFERDAWVLGGRGGQTMAVTLNVTVGEALLVIYGADGTVLISDHAEATQWTGQLPSTQDYFIHVVAGPNGPASYTMQVVIPPGA